MSAFHSTPFCHPRGGEYLYLFQTEFRFVNTFLFFGESFPPIICNFYPGNKP